MKHQSLFKYMPFNAPFLDTSDKLQSKRLSCFEDGKIWYPQANKLNDPYECNPEFSVLTNDDKNLEAAVNSLSSKELDFICRIINVENKNGLLEMLKTPNATTFSRIKTSTFTYDFVHQIAFGVFIGSNFSSRISKVGVLSLTEDPFNLRMWAHYAANSTGICLEFERNKENNLGSKNTKKVKYVKERPKIELHERFNAIRKIIFTKSNIWKYEKEWRHFYLEGDKAFEFPGKLKKVFFGLNCHNDTKSIIKSVFGENVGYEEVVLCSNYSLMSDCGFRHSIMQTDISESGK